MIGEIESQSWPHRLVPPLIDLSMLMGVLFFVPWLSTRLFIPSALNHLVLAPGFLLILFGILSIRSLPDDAPRPGKDFSLLPTCLVFFFTICFAALYVYATGIGGAGEEKDEAVVLTFLIFLPPIIVAFIWPANRAEPGTGKALLAESVGLVSVNYLTLLGAAVWDHFHSLPTPDDPVHATGFWFLILFGILYLLFLAMFGLPRIYLLRATRDWMGLCIYLIGVAIFLWDKVPAVN